MPNRKTREQFISDAIKIHGDKYNYSLVEYINTHTKVKIKCPKHDIFEQLPQDHLKGCGCQKCSNVDKYTTKSFIKESKKIHGNKYNYSLV